MFTTNTLQNTPYTSLFEASNSFISNGPIAYNQARINLEWMSQQLALAGHDVELSIGLINGRYNVLIRTEDIPTSWQNWDATYQDQTNDQE